MTPKCICATDLDTFVVLEAPSTEPDDMAGVKAGWNTVIEAWAKIEPGKGKERYVASRNQSEVFHAVFIRLMPEVKIDNSMRVRFVDAYGKQVYYNVRAVIDLENKHQFLELTCEEGIDTWA